jgi:hypothetical protein
MSNIQKHKLHYSGVIQGITNDGKFVFLSKLNPNCNFYLLTIVRENSLESVFRTEDKQQFETETTILSRKELDTLLQKWIDDKVIVEEDAIQYTALS